MTVVVVAAVIRDRTGRLLLSRRLPGKHLAGTWEFPGGKLEPGERPAAGLARELEEELGIRVAASAPLLSLTHAYPEKTVRLLLRAVDAWEGEAQSREGQPLAWFDPSETVDLPMPAADRPMLKALSLDPRQSISPDPQFFASTSDFLADWESRLAAGYRWLQLRADSLGDDQLLNLARACGQMAVGYGARWLIHGRPELALAAGADGVHLSASGLSRCKTRPLPETALVCASCKDENDLRRAGQLGLDFVTVSPVLAPHSDQDGITLGWAGLENLSACSPLPVMAAGGLKPSDLDQARAHGAFGVAGVSGFRVR